MNDQVNQSQKHSSGEATECLSPTQERGLLSCPFCGYDDVELVATPDDDGAYEVLCQTIGCGARSGDFYDTGKVIKQWNTRAPQWQPIETAPTRGKVLLYFANEPEYTRYSVGFWSVASQDWYGHSMSAGGVCGRHKPTHWMPLPDGPEVNVPATEG